jgi:hypothetical protein
MTSLGLATAFPCPVIPSTHPGSVGGDSAVDRLSLDNEGQNHQGMRAPQTAPVASRAETQVSPTWRLQSEPDMIVKSGAAHSLGRPRDCCGASGRSSRLWIMRPSRAAPELSHLGRAPPAAAPSPASRCRFDFRAGIP